MMAEKWGNWFITALPLPALDSAIENTRIQYERARDRAADATVARHAEFMKTEAMLYDLGESLAAEKARRDG